MAVIRGCIDGHGSPGRRGLSSFFESGPSRRLFVGVSVRKTRHHTLTKYRRLFQSYGGVSFTVYACRLRSSRRIVSTFLSGRGYACEGRGKFFERGVEDIILQNGGGMGWLPVIEE